MIRKAVDLGLLLIIISGLFAAWQSNRERRRLENRYERLAQVIGELRVGDPSQVHVRALETGEPLHFAWRIYLPPNYQQVLRSSTGSISSSSNSNSREIIARVRFRYDDHGMMHVYANFSGGSTRSGFGNKALGTLLRGRWDRIRVEQLGANELAAVGPDRPAVMLRLTLPEDIQREAQQTLSPYARTRYIPVLYELTLDSYAAKP